MKKPRLGTIGTITFLLFFGFLACSRPASPEQDNRSQGEIDWQGISPGSALSVYRELTHLELIIDSRAKGIGTTLTLKTQHPVSRDEATKLIENAFIEQAGLVITHLDAKRASVTYNDALPIEKKKKP